MNDEGFEEIWRERTMKDLEIWRERDLERFRELEVWKIFVRIICLGRSI